MRKQFDTGREINAIRGMQISSRRVGIALKHVFDQIKELEQQKEKEEKQIMLAFSPKLRDIERKAMKIIKGEPISIELLLKDKDKYFNSQEKARIQSLAENNTKIQSYWASVIGYFYGQEFNEADKNICDSILNIEMELTKDSSIELIFQFGPNNYIVPGTYKKYCKFEKNCITKVNGKVQWLQYEECIFSVLFPDRQDEKNLTEAAVVASQFIIQFIPHGLEHFLNSKKEKDEYEEPYEDEENEEIESEELAQSSSKRRK